jgi:outer membrane protein
MPAMILGWSLPFFNHHLSIETVLATPFTLTLIAKGTLASQSLAPYALGNLPTGVPALGSELGVARVLPPVLTATWRFGPLWRLQPYLGLGASYLITLEAHVTNPVLTEVATPTMEIPNKLGFVMQGGLDLQLWRWLYATIDLKYIAGLDLVARVSNLWVRLPKLPLYDAARVGDNEVHVTVNPFVFSVGVGANF